MTLPKKCVVDTNVPIVANLATKDDPQSDVPDVCILNCIAAIEHIHKNGGLVIDAGDEIYNEYRRNLSMCGQPGVGDRFFKWVHDNRWKFPEEDRVAIHATADSYQEFPDHEGLTNFDPSDKKFVAVANAHKNKPPVLQATDSKWWGWKGALAEVDITVHFLCPDYVEAKYKEKMGP